MREIILQWYAKNRRDLPWRNTADVYKILVSEMMLQQTQVDRVIPYYARFLKRFPTAKALAHAPLADVLKYWSGLGYNRRAKFLQLAAKDLTAHTPQDIEALQRLPGVGPYTACAVAAFAWDRPITATDTNIRRVFSRYYFKGGGTIAQLDAQIVKDTPMRGRDWNNALMDFGSLICTASSPKCSLCPLQKTCTAFKAGAQESYLRIAPPQKKFVGSRRQYRGAILKLLLKEPLDEKEIMERLKRQKLKNNRQLKEAVKELQKEGLIKEKNKKYRTA